MKKILLILIIFNSFMLGSTNVKKIIDTNLFELENGQIIKLVGIDIPSINDSNKVLKQFALNSILPYLQNSFLNKNIRVFIISEESEYDLAYVYRQFTQSEKNLNREFLKRGFGKFYDNLLSNNLKDYKSLEKTAKTKNEGIWQIIEDDDAKIFDNKLKQKELNNSKSGNRLYLGLGQMFDSQLISNYNNLSLMFDGTMKNNFLIFNSFQFLLKVGNLEIDKQFTCTFSYSGSLLARQNLWETTHSRFFIAAGPVSGVDVKFEEFTDSKLIPSLFWGINFGMGYQSNQFAFQIIYNKLYDLKSRARNNTFDILFSITI